MVSVNLRRIVDSRNIADLEEGNDNLGFNPHLYIFVLLDVCKKLKKNYIPL